MTKCFRVMGRSTRKRPFDLRERHVVPDGALTPHRLAKSGDGRFGAPTSLIKINFHVRAVSALTRLASGQLSCAAHLFGFRSCISSGWSFRAFLGTHITQVADYLVAFALVLWMIDPVDHRHILEIEGAHAL